MSSSRDGGEGGGVAIETISEYGLRRVSRYGSAPELGEALIKALPESAWGAMAAADVKVRDDGSLMVTTALHFRRQRAAGRLQCAVCGDFLAGTRGLRDHQQVRHGES